VTLRADDASSCFACDLVSGATPLPGGVIHRTDSWVVEHCVGPLGVGTLIVKPIRHVAHVSELEADETAELGQLLKQAATAVSELTDPEQVYVCLWSHADRRPGHIHFVVQPVTGEQMQRFDAHGPALQVAMFESNEVPPTPAVEAFASRAASWFIANTPAQP